MVRKTYLITLVILLIVTLIGCKDTKFNGSITSNENKFVMEYEIFNGTESAQLTLDAGDIIAVDVVSESGKVNIEVKKDGEEPIYTGKNVPTSSFELNISEEGIYTITVAGIKAEGSIVFLKK